MNKIEKLYGILSEKYNFGDYETFASAMEDEEKRRKVFDIASESYNLGDYESFSASLGYTPQAAPSAPSAEEVAEEMRPEEANQRWDERLLGKITNAATKFNDRVTGDSAAYLDTHDVYGNEKEQLSQEVLDQRAQMRDALKASGVIDEMETMKKDARKAKRQSFFEMMGAMPQVGMAGVAPSVFDNSEEEMESRLESIDRAIEAGHEYTQNKLMQSTLDEALDMARQGEINMGDGAFMGNLARGMWDSASRLSTWDMGYSDIVNGLTLNQLVQKWEDDPESLTATEKRVLEAVGMSAAVQEAYAGTTGIGYSVGQSLPQSAAFMVSMGLNPAAGAGEAIAKAAVKKMGKQAIKSLGKKGARVAAGMARLGGEAAEAAVMAGTVGLGRVGADALERINGDSRYYIDDDGYIQYGGQEDQETVARATMEAFGTTFVEGYTEGLGRALFDPALDALKGVVRGGVKKSAINQMGEAVLDIKPSTLANAMRAVKKTAKIDSMVGELLEEEVGMMLNWWDNAWTKEGAEERGETYIFDLENQLTTLLSTCIMTGAINGAEAAGDYATRRRINKAADNADLAGKAVFGEAWDAMRDKIDTGTPEEVVDALRDAFMDPSMDRIKKRALINYASSRITAQYYNAEETRARGELAHEKQQLVDAFDAGYNSRLPEYYNMSKAVAEAQAALTEYGETTGRTEDMNAAIEECYAHPEQMGDILAEMSEQEQMLIEDYIYSKARMDGAYQGRSDKAEDYVDEFAYSMEPFVVTDERGNRTITVANLTRGNSSTPVYVMQNDGKNAFIMYEDGRSEMVLAKELQNVNTQNAERVIDMFRQQTGATMEAETQNAVNYREGVKEPSVGMELRQGDEVLMVTAVNGDEVQVVPAKYDPRTQQMEPTKATPRTISVEEAKQIQNDHIEAEEAKKNFRQGADVTFYVDGEAVNAHVDRGEDVDGMYTVRLDRDVEGLQRVGRYTLDELREWTTPTQQGELLQPNEVVEPVAEVADDVTDNVTDEAAEVADNVEASLEDVVADLLNQGLEDAEVDDFVAYNTKTAMDKADKLLKKKPTMAQAKGDIAQYKALKAAWEEELLAAQRDVQFWADTAKEVQRQREVGLPQQVAMPTPKAKAPKTELSFEGFGDAAMDVAAEILADDAPQNGLELAAAMLSGTGKGTFKLIPESYRRHTGYTTKEQRRFPGLFAKKENGGLTIERMGELVMQADREEGTNFFDQSDPNAGMNAVIEVLSQASTMSDINNYIARAREQRAWEEASAIQRQEDYYEQEAKDAWYIEHYHATEEELDAYNEWLNEIDEETLHSEEEIQEIYIIFADEELEYGNERTDAGLLRAADGREGQEAALNGSNAVGIAEQGDITAEAAVSPDRATTDRVAEGGEDVRAESDVEAEAQEWADITAQRIEELEDEIIDLEDRLVVLEADRDAAQLTGEVELIDDAIADVEARLRDALAERDGLLSLAEEQEIDNKVTADIFEMAVEAQNKKKTKEKSTLNTKYYGQGDGTILEGSNQEGGSRRGGVDDNLHGGEQTEVQKSSSDNRGGDNRSLGTAQTRDTGGLVYSRRVAIDNTPLRDLRKHIRDIQRQIYKAEITKDVDTEYVNNLKEDLEYAKEVLAKKEDNKWGVEDLQPISLSTAEDMFNEWNDDADIKALFDRVFEVFKQFGIDIVFDDTYKVGEKKAVINLTKKLIRLPMHSVYSDSISNQDKANLMLHEMVHGVTSYVLHAYEEGPEYRERKGISLSDGMMESARQLNEIHRIITRDKRFFGKQGVKDVHEMVSELSDPEFRALLKETTIWDKIVNALKQLLGIDVENNALDGASKALDYILDNADVEQYNIIANWLEPQAYGASEDNLRFREKGEPKELIAVHNISEGNLKKVLEAGSLIMPSIAITKADMGHTDFGEISLLFDKSTINPSDRRNKVYGGDAWTPRFPEVRVKVDSDVVKRVREVIYDAIKDERLRSAYSISAELHPSNVEDAISKYGIDSYYRQEWMKLAYLLANGKRVKMPMRKKSYGYGTEKIYELIKERGLSVRDIYNDSGSFYDNNPDFVAEMKEIVNDAKLTNAPADKRDELRAILESKPFRFNLFDLYIRQALQMEDDIKSGAPKESLDKQALRNLVEKKVKTDNADYNKWVDNLFEGIVEKRGIRNDRDLYTPSGNHRSWEQLYDPATPANILKHMLAGNEQGGSGGLFDSNIMGASAETYDSIEEIREKGKQRLKKLPYEEYDEWSESIGDRMSDIVDDFLTDRDKAKFGSSIDAKIEITKAVAKDKTAKGIYKHMKREYPNFTMEHAKQVEEIVKEIQEFATGYFEAKPQRLVSVNEVMAAVVPSNASKEIVDALKNNGIEVVTYKKGDEEARKRVVKRVSSSLDIRFRDGAPFFSNAERAVENIKQQKATPEQWLAMIKKDGGLKAGEDKWMGLSDWLNEQKAQGVKTLTKDEVLAFIRENQIEIEEVEYDGEREMFTDADIYETDEFTDMLNNLVEFDEEDNQYVNRELFDEYANSDPDFFDAFTLDYWGESIDVRDPQAAARYLGLTKVRNPINSTRLDYTTEGLDNKKEIALVVPTIESWNQSDKIHFGDAGEGRAVAWVRFGETTDEDGNRVLVIDEVQSKRHDEGRSKGYYDGYEEAEIDKLTEQRKAILEKQYSLTSGYTIRVEDMSEAQRREYEDSEKELQDTERSIVERRKRMNGVPDAPFDKNYHELIMKRMLRYAAENGFDKVAWTKGAQQAKRYNLGDEVGRVDVMRVIDSEYSNDNNQLYDVVVLDRGGEEYVEYSKVMPKDEILKLFGEGMGGIIIDAANRTEKGEFVGIPMHGYKIGDDGRGALYDEMIPRFMNKYTKKWGAKVGEITLPNVEAAGRTMWSVDVTPEMKESVMQGQPMFRPKGENAIKSSRAEREKMRATAEGLAKKLGLKVNILDSTEGLGERKKESKGWYSISTGEVTAVIPNNANVSDIVQTILHEGVAHHGLRELFGDGFDNMLDNVYNNVAPELKAKIDEIAAKSGVNTRVATEEYLASLAETTNFEEAQKRGWWSKIKQFFADMFNRLGLKDANVGELTDNELRYILWRSYQNLIDPKSFAKPEGYLDDAVRQKELKVGRYADTQELLRENEEYSSEEQDIIAKAKADGTYMKAPNGNPTNLNEKQWVRVRTKNFIRWFGDWINDPQNASKVVDENGEPMVVYHSSNHEFTRFDPERIGTTNDLGFYGRGFYFTPNEQYSKTYGEVSYPVFLNIREPFMATDMNSSWASLLYNREDDSLESMVDEDVVAQYKEQLEGADGVIHNGPAYFRGGEPIFEIVASKPNQIKSATENNGEYSEDEDDIRYRIVDDQAEIDRLESEPTIKAYRAMQVINGELYPPMSAVVDGKLREPIALGQWERSEERPELADDDGNFKLNKGNKKSPIPARYNPYFHSSATPLNDQFAEAQDRPNLVTVEVEIPQSEADGTSGYKAEKAKDAVGAHQWKAGAIQGQISGTRTLYLSRWDKPVRIVPDSEVAGVIAKMLEGTGIVMPSNVVTPSLRAELEKLGVPFVETTNKGVIAEGEHKGEGYGKVYGKKSSKKSKTISEIDRRNRTAEIVDEGPFSDEEREQAIIEESAKLGVKVRVAHSTDELDADAQKDIAKGKPIKGYYDTRTGEVVIYAPHATSVNDVKRTILHETVGHKGLRQLIGEENFNKMMAQMWRMLPEAERKRVWNAALGEYGNLSVAMEEYLAEKAETLEKPKWWQKVITTLKHTIGRIWGARLTDADINYLLWRGSRKLAGDTASDMAVSAMLKRAAKQSTLTEEEIKQLNDAEMSLFEESGRADHLRRRTGSASREYERAVSTLGYRSSEAFQDSMLGLKKLQEAIAKDSGKEIADWEDAYMAENRMTSVNLREMEMFKKREYQQLLKAVSDLMEMGKDTNKAYEAVVNYMMAKHGLERNEKFARRDAEKEVGKKIEELNKKLKSKRINESSKKRIQRQINELNASIDGISKALPPIEAQKWYDRRKNLLNTLLSLGKISADAHKESMDRLDVIYNDGVVGYNRKKDYSGLTALTGESSVAKAEAEARRMVEEFEASRPQHLIDTLWDSTRACTHKTLEISHEAGVMSDDVYNELMNQFEYYIPLRGFDETTAEEVYHYVGGNDSPYNAPIKSARGRKSKAEDPIANIGNMAESAIVEANRNKMKQSFYYMALNHKTDLVSISEVWMRYDAASDTWVAEFPSIPMGATPDQVRAIMKQHEETMQSLAVQYPDMYAKASEKPHIPYRVEKKANEHEHQVVVKMNGKDVVMTVNGNPRAAQAVNGLTNPEANKTTINNIASWINRNLSANFTTRNPAFVVGNFVRDGIYTNSVVWAKESPKYAWAYNKNFGKSTAHIAGLVNKFKRYEAGDKSALDMNDPMQKMFYEFMMNGGETGYTVINSVDNYKKMSKKGIKRLLRKGAMKTGQNVVDALAEGLETFGRWAEDTSRFAAYMTSRQMGRSVERSIYDAKEISVNFNKKGAGSKMAGKFKDHPLAWLAAHASQGGRNLYVFWNAGIQGLTNFGRVAKNNPFKFATMAGVAMGLGAIIPMLFSGDDDDDEYYLLPEYVRRSNICLKAGEKTFITLPLPIEMRALYGIGELAYSFLSGKEKMSSKEATVKLLQQMSQVMPIDMLAEGGGWNALVPSAIKPVWEAYNNVDWTGQPIYRSETPFNENNPTWTLAYKSTSPELVALSKMINEATNEDMPSGKEREYNRGWADNRFLNNPAVWEHIFEGYLGGIGTITNQTKKTISMVWNEDMREVRNAPIVSRFVKSAGDRAKEYSLNGDYYDALDVVDQLSDERAAYKRKAGEAYDAHMRNEGDAELKTAYDEAQELYEEMDEMTDEAIRENNRLKTRVKDWQELQKTDPDAKVWLDGVQIPVKDGIEISKQRAIKNAQTILD